MNSIMINNMLSTLPLADSITINDMINLGILIMKSNITEIKKIKSCPFCGKIPIVTRLRREIYLPKMWQIFCDNTDCVTIPFAKDFESEEEAIDTWNRRV